MTNQAKLKLQRVQTVNREEGAGVFTLSGSGFLEPVYNEIGIYAKGL